MSAHPYADILRAIAEGKQIEHAHVAEHWHELSNFLPEIKAQLLDGKEGMRFRIKPATIQINGREVPEPMRALVCGHDYWLTTIDGVQLWTWTGGRREREWLAAGLCHLTEEAANAHRDALLSFTRRDV